MTKLGHLGYLRRRHVIAAEVGIIVLLMLVNAVFSGAEIAVVAARNGRLRQLADDGRRGAAAVLALRGRPERFFATVQVAISVVSATAGAFGGASFAHHVEPLIARFPPPFAEHTQAIAVAIVVVLISYLSIVLGELVPKSLALKHAERYALWIGPVLLGVAWAARPVIWFLTASSNLILRPFGDQTTFTESKTSLEELKELLAEASDSGAVHAHVGELAARAIALQHRTVREVMVPREEIVGVSLDATTEALQELVLERGHSRMPVYRGTLDDIAGYLMAKDLLAVVWEGGLVILPDIVRPALFVRPDTLAREVLREFQRHRIQLAIVRDEAQRVVGLVTLEDVLEELVGELWSEGELSDDDA